MSIWNTQKARITPEGGLAIQYKNSTSAVSVKGSTVRIIGTMAVQLTQINIPDCMGVVYESGIPDGSNMWIVVSGLAHVNFINAVNAGYLARTFVTGDAGATVGKAIGELFPTPPFASDKHFCEIGHVAETTTVPGLALVNLHFN